MFAVFFIAAAFLFQNQPHREVKNNVLTSDATPKLTLKVASEFQFVGSVPFNIRNIAEGERFVWVVADATKHVKKLFIVQFEGYMPNIDSTYRFAITGPIHLGDYDYRHNCWFWDNGADIASRQHPDADSSYNLLVSKGYSLDPELAMSRFARIVGDDRRNELIFFYVESLKDLGHKLSDFPEDKPRSAGPELIEKGLTERSLRSFTVSDSK